MPIHGTAVCIHTLTSRIRRFRQMPVLHNSQILTASLQEALREAGRSA